MSTKRKPNQTRLRHENDLLIHVKSNQELVLKKKNLRKPEIKLDLAAQQGNL